MEKCQGILSINRNLIKIGLHFVRKDKNDLWPHHFCLGLSLWVFVFAGTYLRRIYNLTRSYLDKVDHNIEWLDFGTNYIMDMILRWMDNYNIIEIWRIIFGYFIFYVVTRLIWAVVFVFLYIFL